MLSSRLNVGRGTSITSGLTTPAVLVSSALASEIPLLTYGQEDVGVSPDKHALIMPLFMSHGKKVHPMSYPDSTMSVPPRPMDPKKDLDVYVYGSVAWKDRMKDWKKTTK